MDIALGMHLNELTREFYQCEAQSFSATRQSEWTGWNRVLDDVAPLLGTGAKLLDIGCGNLRFERFVEASCPAGTSFYCIDSNEELVADGASCLQGSTLHFQQLDVAEALAAGNLASAIEAPVCDVAVAFGLAHHMPLREWRLGFVDAMLAHVRSGGFIALSLWQFMKSERLAKKAVAATEEGCRDLGICLDADDGDYLLGWQDGTNLRYCHNFSNAEVDEILAFAQSRGAVLEDAFSADGHEGNMNRYLVLEKA